MDLQAIKQAAVNLWTSDDQVPCEIVAFPGESAEEKRTRSTH